MGPGQGVDCRVAGGGGLVGSGFGLRAQVCLGFESWPKSQAVYETRPYSRRCQPQQAQPLCPGVEIRSLAAGPGILDSRKRGPAINPKPNTFKPYTSGGFSLSLTQSQL